MSWNLLDLKSIRFDLNLRISNAEVAVYAMDDYFLLDDEMG